MKTPDPNRSLRLQVRALWCGLALLCVAAAANVRPLQISNADNTPTTAVSLSSAHWTGTLDAARLPGGSIVTSLNGQTGAVTGAQAVAGADVHVLNLLSDEDVVAYDLAAINVINVSYGSTIIGPTGTDTPTISASGALLADGSKIYYPDGATTLADDSYDLFTNALYSGSYQMTDASGSIFAANKLVSDGTYLTTVGQPYQSGAVTPTGYLVLKDSTGAIYHVPAVAAP